MQELPLCVPAVCGGALVIVHTEFVMHETPASLFPYGHAGRQQALDVGAKGFRLIPIRHNAHLQISG